MSDRLKFQNEQKLLLFKRFKGEGQCNLRCEICTDEYWVAGK